LKFKYVTHISAHDNSGVPRGSRGGGTSEGVALLGKNVKIYVKMVKFTLKKVKFSVKMDKRAEN